MKLNLSLILSRKYNEIEVHESLDLRCLERGGEVIRFPHPALVEGKLYKPEEQVIRFAGELETVIEAECGRCLSNIQENISVSFDEIVYAGGKEEEYDLILEYDGKELDLEQFLWNVLTLKLPMKFLCDDACKGLCPFCGTNLNTSECDCKNDNIDESLMKLKELL